METTTSPKHHAWEDLRRLLTTVMTSSGLAAARASALASRLLELESMGAQGHGIATLPRLLDALERKEWSLQAEGKFEHERCSLAMINGQNGVAPLVLARAATIASQKAREYGMGQVRLHNVRDPGALATIVADVAIGPQMAFLTHSEGAWACGLPSRHGLPFIHDSVWQSSETNPFAPWQVQLREGEWQVLVFDLNNPVDSLQEYHNRVETQLSGQTPGWLHPEAWRRQRSEMQTQGVKVDSETEQILAFHAKRLGLEFTTSSNS